MEASLQLYKEKFYNFDQRTSFEREEQQKKIDELTTQNYRIFHLEETSKSEKHSIQKYLPHIIRKVKFSNNWYLKYTDNIDAHHSFEISLPVLSFHGCPGYYNDWIRLEKELGGNKFRMINFFVPGFDGEPENDRGDYDGTLKDFNQLLIMFLDYLKISRAIFFVHSMGGLLISSFCQKNASRVAGLVYLAAPSISWYIGYMGFYGSICARSGMNRKIGEHYFLNLPKFREILRKKINEENKNFHFEYKTTFPDFYESEIASFIKLLTSLENTSEIFGLLRKTPKIIKLLTCGRNDPLNEYDKFVECFYYNIYGEGRPEKDVYINNKEIAEEFKKSIQACQELKDLHLNFKYESLQENFVFAFDHTGHNVHKKRCRELVRPIIAYAKLIEIIEKHNYKKPNL